MRTSCNQQSSPWSSNSHPARVGRSPCEGRQAGRQRARQRWCAANLYPAKVEVSLTGEASSLFSRGREDPGGVVCAPVGERASARWSFCVRAACELGGEGAGTGVHTCASGEYAFSSPSMAWAGDAGDEMSLVFPVRAAHLG